MLTQSKRHNDPNNQIIMPLTYLERLDSRNRKGHLHVIFTLMIT